VRIAARKERRVFVSALFTALTVAAAALLAVAGAAKLRTPAPAASMLVGFWPRLRPLGRARTVARGVAAVELGVGVACVALGGRITAALLAVCYLALTAVAVRLATGAQPASCGCFGAADGDVGPAHVVLDCCAAAVAVTAVFVAPDNVAGLFHAGVGVGLTSCAQAALLAALGYLSITALPALAAARRTLE
jgi:hypothetical protein